MLDCDVAALSFECMCALLYHPAVARASSSNPCRSLTHCCGPLALQFLPDDRQVAALKGIPHLTNLKGWG